MRVQGLIQAAGRGSRLGQGPKAFVMLGGLTLLERAVALLAPAVESLLVAAPPDALERAEALVGGPRVRVLPGAASRSETTRRLIGAAEAPWLLLHDVVHPFAKAGLVRALLAAAADRGAAAPAIANAEFLYDLAGRPLHPPGALLVGQKPVAFARQAALEGYGVLERRRLAGDPSLLEVLEEGGVRAAFIPGSGDNLKITTAADLRLARALLALGADEGQEP